MFKLGDSMKRIIKTLFGLTVVLALSTVSLPSSAAEANNNGVTIITWDEASIYKPVASCSSFAFNYANRADVLLTDVEILNAYGDKLGSTIVFSGSGSFTLQVCSQQDFTAPYTIRIETSMKAGAGTFTSTFPFNFLDRPNSGSTKPTPAPVVTPSPKPTADASTTPTTKLVKCKSRSTNKTRIFERTNCPKGFKLVKRF